MRILLLAALGLLLTSCANSKDSPGFIAAWSQFLELDNSGPAQATSANPDPTTGPLMTAAAAAKVSTLAGELNDEVELMRNLYGDATSINAGFSTVEETYRTLPGKFKEQVSKIRENKGQADAGTVQRRLSALTLQALNILDRQHTRVITLQGNFEQKLNAVMKRVPELENSCAKVKAQPSPRQEEVTACSAFLDSSTMLKTKSDIVVSGFASLQAAYEQAKQTQQGLNAAIAAGK